MQSALGDDALLFFGQAAAHHDVQYLTGWPPGWESWLLFVGDILPILFVPSPNHRATAERMAGGDATVRLAGWDPAAAIASELEGAGVARGRIGLIGRQPYQVHEALVARLPGCELVDRTSAFRRLRLVKSAEEIEWTRRAAGLADAAMSELTANARPGMRDFELGAVVEQAYRRAGGEHGICFLASAPMTGGGPAVPAQVWSHRRVESGDAVTIELSVGLGGCTSQVLRTIALGEPPEQFVHLHEVAERTFHAIAALVRPGTSAAELLEAAGIIDRAGYTVVDDVVHGYGGGYLPPVLRTPQTQGRPPPDLVLGPGMFLVVQPNVVTRDGRLGVQTGELLVVTEPGYERMHRLPMGLLQAGSSFDQPFA